MRLHTYTVDLSQRHEISHAIGIAAEWYYNAIGSLIIILDADAYNVDAVRLGGVIYDQDSGQSFIVQEIEYSDAENQLTATAYTANWLLNTRAVLNSYTINSASSIVSCVNANLRGLERVAIAPAAIAISANDELQGCQLLDGLLPIIGADGAGNRMVWSDRTRSWTFELFRGRDLRTGLKAMTFSDVRGTASNLVIDDDNSIEANVIYAMKKTADGVESIAVYDAGGAVRREKWLTGAYTQNSDETAAQFNARVQSALKAEAALCSRRRTFEVALDSTELGTAYDIGDQVNCVSSRFGYSFDARITGVRYTFDQAGESTSLVLGDVRLTQQEVITHGY